MKVQNRFLSYSCAGAALATLCSVTSVLAAPRDVAFTQDIATLRTELRDPGIDVAGDRVQLAHTFLIEDEVGNTDQHNTQALSATTWARKTIVMPYVADAEVVFFGSAEHVTVNGHEAPKPALMPSTAWMRVDVPAAWLHPGANDIVLSGGGYLLIENSLYPDRSARSIDGGRTWDKDRLGKDGVNNGEYLVRMRVKANAPSATITSQPVDLLDADNATATRVRLHPQATINSVRLALVKPQTMAGTSLRLEARTGSTPTYNADTWSEWTTADGNAPIATKASTRYLQWRAVLTTNSPNASSSFSGIRISEAVDEQPLPANVKVTSLEDHPLVSDSYAFAYQPSTSARLKLLREKYHLDQVVAPGKTELEKLVLLRNWARNQWPNGWAHNDLLYCPPWDALLILDMAPREQALGMCTHYSTVFVQCALALGWNARHLILDHHCAAEVWSNQFGKWIVMDTGNSTDPTLNCYFARNGVPLDALEIRDLLNKKELDKIQVVYAAPREPVSGTEIANRNQIQFVNYIRVGIPFRNNHLDTPFPGELEQGDASYFHDGYLWWQDGPVPTAYPEYRNVSYRTGDFYPNLDQVAIDLQATDTAGKIRVTLATQTPNFSHFMLKIDDGAWQKQPASAFDWPLHAGQNHIEVKPVNQFGQEGQSSTATVEVGG